jgi:tetratricopeptide (TPR) repeat protein
LFAPQALAQAADEAEAAPAGRALDLLRQKEYRRALDALTGLPHDAEQQISACYLRGYALYQLEDYHAAREQLRASEERGEDAPPLRTYLRGSCALESGDVEAALADFEKYASLSSDGRDADRRVVSTIRFSAAADEAARLVNHAEGSRPPTPRRLLWGALLAYDAGKLEQADSLATQFLATAPTDARGLFWRCKVRHGLGRDAEAVADYAALLRAHPIHAGGFDEAAARRRIAKPGDLGYGQAQVERLLRDRPRLGGAFDSQNPLHVWAALQFESVLDGHRIVWDRVFARDDASAYHGFDGKRNVWCIRVSPMHRVGPKKGQRQDADELWACVLFELENAGNRPFFQRLEAKARDGAIDRRDFVLGLAELEWQASLRIRAFHALVYFPWAVEKGLSSNYAAWFEGGLTFQDRTETFADNAD